MSLKDIILNKGWAGRTISRPETVARLNPHIQSMSTLLLAYDIIGGSADESRGGDDLDEQLRILRMDIGKFSETIASAGGVAHRSPDAAAAQQVHSWSDVLRAEQSLLSALDEENDIEHQMRTRAILAVVSGNTETRLRILRQLV